jgi:hypothetical protein
MRDGRPDPTPRPPGYGDRGYVPPSIPRVPPPLRPAPPPPATTPREE